LKAQKTPEKTDHSCTFRVFCNSGPYQKSYHSRYGPSSGALSGGIDPTIIEAEVHRKLSQYDIDEDIIENITDEVKVLLEERGVRLHE